MALGLLDVRIAQAWVEATPRVLQGQAAGPLAGLGSAVHHPFIVRAALAQRRADAAMPWPAAGPARLPTSNRFWNRTALDAMRAGGDAASWPGVACERHVPLRLTVALGQPMPGPPARRTYVEGYAWPTGVGLLLNVWLAGTLSPQQVKDALSLLRGGELEVRQPGGQTERVRAARFCHDTLRLLRQGAFGELPDGERPDPVLIVTVVRAAADAPARLKRDLTATRKALLEAIAATWNDRLEPGDAAADTDVILWGKRVRLVWQPTKFLAAGTPHTLGCLHRNLMQASLQAEALAAAAVTLADLLQREKGLPAALEDTARRVLDRLDDISAGRTYSMPALVAQLERERVAGAVAALRQR